VNLCSEVGLFFFKRDEIFFPFGGEEIFFFVVTLFAGRHKVPLHGFPAAHDRDQMVHRQIGRLELSFAIIADAGRALPFPPLGTAQFAGLCLLSFDVFVINGNEIIGHRMRRIIQEPEVRSQEKGEQFIFLLLTPAALILLASSPIVTPKNAMAYLRHSGITYMFTQHPL
jgi:hypothetical protein